MDILSVQRKSFEDFLQPTVEPEKRTGEFHEIFGLVFPIRSHDKIAELQCMSFSLEKPKYDESECLRRGMTYSAPMKVIIRLLVFSEDKKTLYNIKEQEVYFGEFPLMTERATFVFQGEEKFIPSSIQPRRYQMYTQTTSLGEREVCLLGLGGMVSIIQKSPAVFECRILTKEPLYMLLGDHILREAQELTIRKQSKNVAFLLPLTSEHKGKTLSEDVVTRSGEVLLKKGEKLTTKVIKQMQESGIFTVPLAKKDLKDLYLVEPMITGSSLVEAGTPVSLVVNQLVEGTGYQVYSKKARKSKLPPQEFSSASEVCDWVKSALFPGFFQKFQETDLFHELYLLLTSPQEKKIEHTEHGPNEQLALVCWRGLHELRDEIEQRMNQLSKQIDTLMPHDLINARPFCKALYQYFEELPMYCGDAPILSLALQRENPPKTWVPSEEKRALEESLLSAFVDKNSNWRLATALDSPETPQWQTPLEKKIGQQLGVKCAISSGRVFLKTNNTIMLSSPPREIFYEAEPPRFLPTDVFWRYRPCVDLYQTIAAGETLFDSPATQNGSLALGVNLRVLVEPTSSILLSKRAANALRITRCHKVQSALRDTKKGPESLSKTPPGIDLARCLHLDDSGIVKEGAIVNAGDVLVGKNTGVEAYVSGDSFVAPPGGPWRVISTEHFSRKGRERVLRHEEEIQKKITALEQKREQQSKMIKEHLYEKVFSVISGKPLLSDLSTEQLYLELGKEISREVLQKISIREFPSLPVGDECQHRVERLCHAAENDLYQVETECSEAIARWMKGDELPPGVISFHQVLLLKEEPAQEGTLLLSRYTERFEVQKICEEEKMPVWRGETRADLVLPALHSAGARLELGMTDGRLYVMRSR